jgi:hypothetical protein
MATLQFTASTMLAYIEHGAEMCAAGPSAAPAGPLLADGVPQWAQNGRTTLAITSSRTYSATATFTVGRNHRICLCST